MCGRVFGGGVVLDLVVMNSLIGLVGLVVLFGFVVLINQANYYPYDHNHHHRIFY